MRTLPSLLLAAALGTVLAPATQASAGGPLPWIDDDYPRALAAARAKNVPILLEAWAPWCHSCRSMQGFVFPDKRLASSAPKAVWLSIDTEKASNATTVEKYPVAAWPSLFVIDPRSETILVRWTGSATVEQLQQLVAQGTQAYAAGKTGAGSLAEADRLYAAQSWADAAKAYAAAIAAAPQDWSDLPRASDAMLFSLQSSEGYAQCAQSARELLPRLRGTPSFGNAAASGLDCALQLDKSTPARAAMIAAFEKDATAALANAALAADDRSGIYQELIAARDDAGDEAGKKKLEADWVALLEHAAETAPSPQARAAFDSHRLSAYLEVGEPQRAIPMLEQSAKDFPDDYNPPARMAMAYHALKQYDRALAASDQALAKAYGPRRLVILRTRATILEAKGDKPGAKKVVEQALAEAKALPKGQRSDGTIAALEKKLAGMG